MVKSGRLTTKRKLNLKKALLKSNEAIRKKTLLKNQNASLSNGLEHDRLDNSSQEGHGLEDDQLRVDEQMPVDDHNYSLPSKHREEDCTIESAPFLEENNSSSLGDEQIRVDEQMQVDEQIMDKQQEQSPKDEEIIVIICDDLPSEHQQKDVQIQTSDNMKNKQTLKEISQDFNVSEIKGTRSPEIQQVEQEQMVLALNQRLKQIIKNSNVPEVKRNGFPPAIQQAINEEIALEEERKLIEIIQELNSRAAIAQEIQQIRNEEKEIEKYVLKTDAEEKKSSGNENLHFRKALTGQRIVDLGFVLEQIAEISDHGVMNCGWKYMQFIKEIQDGMSSTMYFECKLCGDSAKFKTIRDKPETEDRVVMGCLVAGIGLTQFEDVCGALNMPLLKTKKYVAAEKRVSERIKIAALKSMKEAAQEEAKICRELNSVDESGTPLLTVIADGAWSKRSYKTRYDAKSGVAAIIGAHTKKILYLGVKNSYCCTCMRAKKLKIVPKVHKCYLNWNGTATAMESSIIVEGFQKSMEMHGVIYDRLIADGDSSTMKKLQIAQPYGPNRQIKKIECKNHLLRNYCYKLRDLAKNRISSSNKLVPARLRQQLKSRLMPLRSAVSSAIAFRRKEDGPVSEQLEKLMEDLLNGPSHVFGEHAKCIERGYFCQHEPVQGGIVEEMRQCGLFDDIMAILNRLLKHLNSLYMAQTNNICENYNAIVNKFVGGKRINFTQTGGYEHRCFAAALHFNSKGRTIFHGLQVDGEFTNRYMKLRTEIYNRPTSRKKPLDRKYLGADSDYGLIEEEIAAETEFVI